MTDTPESIAARIGEFVRSEAALARRQASEPEDVDPDALNPSHAVPPTAMPSVEDLVATYRSCLQKFSGRERAALDRIIRAL